MASSMTFKFQGSTGLHRAALCVVAAVALAAAGCADPVAPGDGDTAQTAQAITAATQLCDAWIPPSGAHTTIAVASGSTITTCINLARSLVLGDFRLGCRFDDGTISWGRAHDDRFGAHLPQPNCGWSCTENANTDCDAGVCHCGGSVRPLPGFFTCEGRCITTDSCRDICGTF